LSEQASRTELVEVIDEACVVPGGNVERVWFVELRDGFIRAKHSPTAKSEFLSRGPGVIFRMRILLELPQGTLLERRESRPVPSTRTTLEHLTAAARTPARRHSRSRYRVGRGGSLTPEDDGPKRR
jgi:hypothetical protein